MNHDFGAGSTAVLFADVPIKVCLRCQDLVADPTLERRDFTTDAACACMTVKASLAWKLTIACAAKPLPGSERGDDNRRFSDFRVHATVDLPNDASVDFAKHSVKCLGIVNPNQAHRRP